MRSVITDVEHLSREAASTVKNGYHCRMAFFKKDSSQLQSEEHDLHVALKAWYLTPGIQQDLRNKENDAVQTVLAVLERRTAAFKTENVHKRSAATKPR